MGPPFPPGQRGFLLGTQPPSLEIQHLLPRAASATGGEEGARAVPEDREQNARPTDCSRHRQSLTPPSPSGSPLDRQQHPPVSHLENLLFLWAWPQLPVRSEPDTPSSSGPKINSRSRCLYITEVRPALRGTELYLPPLPVLCKRSLPLE